MIGLIQRVRRACVEVDGSQIGAIEAGILVFVCAERGDTTAQAVELIARIVGYRIFADENGRMNRSLAQTGGGLLLVPQFTLAADTRRGCRPSFAPAAPPEMAHGLFDAALDAARKQHRVAGCLSCVQSGQFGADMQVSLVNDGPVTFWLRAVPVVPAGG